MSIVGLVLAQNVFGSSAPNAAYSTGVRLGDYSVVILEGEVAKRAPVKLNLGEVTHLEAAFLYRHRGDNTDLLAMVRDNASKAQPTMWAYEHQLMRAAVTQNTFGKLISAAQEIVYLNAVPSGRVNTDLNLIPQVQIAGAGEKLKDKLRFDDVRWVGYPEDVHLWSPVGLNEHAHNPFNAPVVSFELVNAVNYFAKLLDNSNLRHSEPASVKVNALLNRGAVPSEKYLSA